MHDATESPQSSQALADGRSELPIDLQDDRSVELEQLWPRGPLHAPLFAHLIGKVGQLTTDFDALCAAHESTSVVAVDDRSLWRASREAGWTMGVLAAANGIDLLHARREGRGLQIMLESVRSLLESEGSCLLAPREWPASVTLGTNDWEVPWAIANALYLAGRDESSTNSEWALVCLNNRLSLTGFFAAGSELERFVEAVAQQLRGVSYEISECQWAIHFELGSVEAG